MGGSQPEEKVYAKFEGESKPGESRVLRHVLTVIHPADPKSMLEQLE